MSKFIGCLKTNRGYKLPFTKIGIGKYFSIPWNPYLYVRIYTDENGKNAEEYYEKHRTYIPAEAEVRFYSKVEEF